MHGFPLLVLRPAGSCDGVVIINGLGSIAELHSDIEDCRLLLGQGHVGVRAPRTALMVVGNDGCLWRLHSNPDLSAGLT